MIQRTTVEINGPVLRHLRVQAGLGVAELAEIVGVDRSHIANLELGHSRRVSPKVFNALLAALSIEDVRVLKANPYGASVEDLESAS